MICNPALPFHFKNEKYKNLTKNKFYFTLHDLFKKKKKRIYFSNVLERTQCFLSFLCYMLQKF